MREIKPLLRQMIDNNKPHWRPETIRGAHKMLDEYEAKAEAFDRIVKELKITEFDMYEKELVDERRGLLSFGREISRFLNEFESGGSDD